MNLLEFIINAKKKGYAGGTDYKVLDDKGKEFIFKEGNYEYRDKYYGFNPFTGHEIILKDGKAVWVMNYTGNVTVSTWTVKTSKVFKFLREAMCNYLESPAGITASIPVRGARLTLFKNFKYTSNIEGSFNKFKGIERIYYREYDYKEVYIGYFHGGTVEGKL